MFLHGNDVWVKHRDYFSPSIVMPEDYGKPLNILVEKYTGKHKPDKFVYGDAWGDIIARQEAWLRFVNLRYWIRQGTFPLEMLNEILRQMEREHNMDEYKLCCTYMERFLDNVILQVGKLERSEEEGGIY